jgi:hypothetical protein
MEKSIILEKGMILTDDTKYLVKERFHEQKRIISYDLLKEKILKVDILDYDCLDADDEFLKYKEKYDLDDDDVYERLELEDERFCFLESYITADDFIDYEIPYVYNKEVKYIREMNYYLHGYCDEFAYALANKFGYNIVLFCASDGDKFKNIVHAFCVKEVNGKNVYIDIRGKSRLTSLSDIMDIYEEMYDFYFIKILSPKDALTFYKKVCKFDLSKYSDENLKELYEYLELFKEKYCL